MIRSRYELLVKKKSFVLKSIDATKYYFSNTGRNLCRMIEIASCMGSMTRVLGAPSRQQIPEIKNLTIILPKVKLHYCLNLKRYIAQWSDGKRHALSSVDHRFNPWSSFFFFQLDCIYSKISTVVPP